jgi:hypothetical protein
MLFSNWQFLQLFFKIISSLLGPLSSFSLYFMLVHQGIIAIYQLTYGSFNYVSELNALHDMLNLLHYTLSP